MRVPLFRSRGPWLLSPPTMPSFSFTNAARVRGTITREALESALARLGRRHPVLAARVVHEGEDYFLTDEGSLPIALDVVDRVSAATWMAAVDTTLQVHTAFATGPLCRCVWVRGTDEHELILLYDHGTNDGRSGVVVIRDLLAFLADPALTAEPLEPLRINDALPDFALQRLDELMALPPIESARESWRFEPSTRPRAILPVSLSSEETEALAAQCRRHGVSVQAALCAAYLKPFAEREPDKPVRTAEVPIDLRSSLKQNAEDRLANCIGLVFVEVDCGLDDLWDVARSAKRALDAIDKDAQLTQPPMIYYLVEKLPQPMHLAWEYDLSISNVGRTGIPERYGELELVQIFGPTFNVGKDGHKVLGLTTTSGRLSGTYTSCDPEAPELARRGMELLRAMLRG